MQPLEIPFAPAVPLHRQIETALRQRIASGALAPGASLPSTREMARQMGVHPLTLQKALRRLKEDGLIERTPRVGSFVSAAAPTAAIAIVVGPDLKHETAHFHRALVRALQDDTDGRWLSRIYDGFPVEPTKAAVDTVRPFRALRRDSGHLAFKGVLAVGIGHRPWTAIEPLRALPSAWLSVASLQSDLAFDHAHFVRAAVAHLAARGCRRLAYVRTFSPWSWSRGDRRVFAEAAAGHAAEPLHIHDFDRLGEDGLLDEYAAYRRVGALVADWRRDGWPDAVIVTDDVLTRSVALALLHVNEPGARRPALLTWANDCVRFHYGLPVARYEIPVAQCARRLREWLELRMNGKTPPAGQELVRGRIVDDK